MPFERRSFDRNAEHGKAGHGGRHAGQVGGATAAAMITRSPRSAAFLA